MAGLKSVKDIRRVILAKVFYILPAHILRRVKMSMPTCLTGQEYLREEFRELTGHYPSAIFGDDWTEEDLEVYYNNNLPTEAK